MIIYNKYKSKLIDRSISIQTVKPSRPVLTKENKLFLKSLNLHLKNNV